MKQGRATHDGSASTKVEPRSHAVSPEAVDQLGQALGRPGKQLYEGRGLEAPMAGETTHKSGSQGRY